MFHNPGLTLVNCKDSEDQTGLLFFLVVQLDAAFFRGNDGTFFKKYSLSTMSPELGLSPKHLGLLRFHNQPGVDYEKVGQVPTEIAN